MAPWAIMLLRLLSTTSGWQPEVPQLMWATRRSPGFTNMVNSGDSWLSSVYDRTGLPVVRQASGNLGWTCANSLTAVDGLPPWQSTQPSLTVSLKCGSCDPWWHWTQPTLFRSTSASVCLVRSTPNQASGIGKAAEEGRAIWLGWTWAGASRAGARASPRAKPARSHGATRVRRGSLRVRGTCRVMAAADLRVHG